MNSQVGSINPSIAQTPAAYNQTPAGPGVFAPPHTLENGQSMNRAMQDQIINSGSSNDGSHDSSGRGSSNNSADEMMRKQMMMQMMMAGSSAGINPREMMAKMMAGGPLDTS